MPRRKVLTEQEELDARLLKEVWAIKDLVFYAGSSPAGKPPTEEELQQAHYWEVKEARHQEARRRWLVLWKESFEGDKLKTHAVGLAALTTQFGAWEAIYTDRDYLTALEYIETFFSHPESKAIPDGRMTLLDLLGNQMLCLFQTGQEARAIEAGRSMLATARRSDLPILMYLMHPPLAFLPHMPQERMASAALTEFLWDIIQTCRPRARRKLPVLATYAQLCEAWLQAFPKQKRAGMAARWPEILGIR